MTTPTPTVATCCACGTTRDLALLLRVSETGGLHRSKFVCRPGHALDDYPYCFRDMVGRRDLEAITLAVPEPPLLPHVEHLAPVPRPVVRSAPAPVEPFRPGRLVASDMPDNEGMW